MGVIRVAVDKQVKQVGVRTARIVSWVLNHAERIEQGDQQRLVFDCKRRSVIAELSERHDVPELAG